MTHTYSKLIYHMIWSTKNRESFISNEIKNRLYAYIRAVSHDKKHFVYTINGMPDHVHLLVGLSPSTCISDYIKHVKTASSRWMHSDPLNSKNFAWQEGFAAYTVGYSTMDSTTRYIQNQETHHETETFDQEYKRLLTMQNIIFDERFVLG